jgi:HNH endonuclease
MDTLASVLRLSDADLIAEVARCSAAERQATAVLIASLAEFDARRLYLGEGCSSLFTYCTQVLHLSEQAAYGRIQAARAARRFPIVLELLTNGAINLTVVGLLAPHLTEENHRTLLEAARHKSKRDVEYLVATVKPQPDVPTSVRKLPAAKSSDTPPTPLPPQESTHADVVSPTANRQSASSSAPVVRPLAPERYKVQFTVSRQTYEKLRRVQDLLRHSVPNGDPAAVFDRALTALLSELERTKLAATARPHVPQAQPAASRHIPAAVKREVWKRDGGRCAFVGTNGRCAETGFLEFHHVRPFADGGPGTIDNIELRCRAHNAYESEQYFGTGLFTRETSVAFWPNWVRTQFDD